MIFLETLGMTEAGGIFAIIAGMMAFFAILTIAVYVYMSFAFMTIAKKNNQSSPGLAWIPLVGPSLVASKAAKMHWWPILLIIGMFIPFLNFIAGIIFTIFFVIWVWKMFEAVGRPGWWSILQIIPFINIIWLILLGVAAWGK